MAKAEMGGLGILCKGNIKQKGREVWHSMKGLSILLQLQSEQICINVSQGLNNSRSNFHVEHQSSLLSFHPLLPCPVFVPSFWPFCSPLHLPQKLIHFNLFILNFSAISLAH